MAERNIIPTLLVIVFACAVPSVLLLGGFLDAWELIAYDLLAKSLLEEDAESDRIALIMIDTNSLEWGAEYHRQYGYLLQKGVIEGNEEGGAYGADTLFLWPWKRSVYEIIIDFLARGGARAVAFDMVFSTPHPSGASDSDESLGAATLMQNEQGRTFVIHTLNFHETEEPPEEDALTPYERKCLEAASIRVGGLDESPFPFDRSDEGFYYKPILPYRAILNDILDAFDGGGGLLRLGVVAVQPDADAVIRRARVLTRYGNWIFPSLGLAAALAYLESMDGRGTVKLETDAEGIAILRGPAGASTRIPLTASGDILVHYQDTGLEGREGQGRFRIYPAYRILVSAMENDRLIEEMGFDPGTFRIDPEIFRDRIVFVGANASGLYDLKATPVSENYPGVKVHAAVAENLLCGDPLRRAVFPARIAAAVLLALGTILGTLFLKRTWLKLLVAAAVVLVYTATVAVLFTSTLLWIDSIIPLFGVAVAYMSGTTYNYFTEGRHKREITRMFQHYAPPSVVNRLVRNPEALNTKGERVELTVFFSDIQGFTSLSNAPGMRQNPETLTNHLNDYLTEMTAAIHECGGTLDKYIGDAVVAFFGAPLPMANHAKAACSAAIACQRRLDNFNDGARQKGLPEFITRIGLYTGEAIVGNVGSKVRLSYTAIGSPVNFGARLEGTNKVYGTRVMAGGPTVRRAGGGVCARLLDVVRVPGIEQDAPPLEIYEILAMEEGLSDGRKALLDLYGRALSSYQSGAFEEALGLFERAALEYEDPPAKTLASRCRGLIENPPRDWDGVFRIESK